MFPADTSLSRIATRAPSPLTLLRPAAPRRYGGLIVSLLLHGAVLALVVTEGERLWKRTPVPGPISLSIGGEAAGGSGGESPRVAYITLPPIPKAEAPPAPKPAPVIPTPRPVAQLAPEPETLPLEQPSFDTVSPVATTTPDTSGGESTGPGQGAGAGSSTGDGAGPGGGGAGPGLGGEGGRVRPPEPRDMAFPFDNPPKELRGISLKVTFWVRVDGRVDRYLVEPEIKDREYARKFDEVMRAFRFDPARAPDGTRIPGTTKISFTLPGKSSS
jgi:hypothetical protein